MGCVINENDVINNFPVYLKFAPKLSTFILAKYRISVELLQPFTFKGYKGSIFHGGFGYALKLISPSTFHYFFNPPFKGDPPKPYIIIPPLDKKEHYKAGDSIVFELVLIGPAVQHFPICFAAFEKLGELGLGKERAQFKLKQIEYFDKSNQPQIYFNNNNWQFIDTSINGAQLTQVNEQKTRQISLCFTSYLRLKNNAKLVNQPPSFRLLMDRLLGRLCTLSKYYGKENEVILYREERLQLLAQAELITTSSSDLKWQEWRRYSGRQKTEMSFGGLVGTVEYCGELTPFMPYLKLGEWLHVGGKTSFGLGGYRVFVT